MLNQLKENILCEKNLIGAGIALMATAVIIALPIAVFCLAIDKIIRQKV